MIDFKDTIDNYLQKPFEEQLETEKMIFNQFQNFDFLIYREQRLKHLNKINSKNQLDALIAFVKYFEPKIGLFAGSFNPFHKGHYNVLQKAERIFDKVIISFGKNPEKESGKMIIPNTIKNRQICHYENLLTDFIDTLKYDVTVIRGLRNSTDFQYEQNQYRYIQELKPDIKIVSIFCNKEFEHISSSGIRTLEKYNKHQQYLLD